MPRIIVLHGPNLNLLGTRDPEIYGTRTLNEINGELVREAAIAQMDVDFFQSNHEGSLIDRIHEERKIAHGIIINPGALTHYSYALVDALDAVGLPVVEVHISDIHAREEWRSHSVITPVAWRTVIGKGPAGYVEAFRMLVEYLESNPPAAYP